MEKKDQEVLDYEMESGIPRDYECPISFEIMNDPVIAADGLSYERAAIEEWFDERARKGEQATSPRTNEPLKNTKLRSNLSLKFAIDEFNQNRPDLEIKRLREQADELEEKIKQQDDERDNINQKRLELLLELSSLRAQKVGYGRYAAVGGVGTVAGLCVGGYLAYKSSIRVSDGDGAVSVSSLLYQTLKPIGSAIVGGLSALYMGNRSCITDSFPIDSENEILLTQRLTELNTCRGALSSIDNVLDEFLGTSKSRNLAIN